MSSFCSILTQCSVNESLTKQYESPVLDVGIKRYIILTLNFIQYVLFHELSLTKDEQQDIKTSPKYVKFINPLLLLTPGEPYYCKSLSKRWDTFYHSFKFHKDLLPIINADLN